MATDLEEAKQVLQYIKSWSFDVFRLEEERLTPIKNKSQNGAPDGEGDGTMNVEVWNRLKETQDAIRALRRALR